MFFREKKEKTGYVKPMANKLFSLMVNLVKEDAVYKIPVKQKTKKCNNKTMEKEKSRKAF